MVFLTSKGNHYKNQWLKVEQGKSKQISKGIWLTFAKVLRQMLNFLSLHVPNQQSLEEIQPNLASYWASGKVAEYMVCHSTSCVYRRSDPLAFVSDIRIYKNLSADLIPESNPIITRKLFYESALHNTRT